MVSLHWVRRSKATHECGALRKSPKEKHDKLGEGELGVNVGGLTPACARTFRNVIGVANEILSMWWLSD